MSYEQDIADVLMAEGWTCDMHEPDARCEDCQGLYARTAKAILALPDPVHEAARLAYDALERWCHFNGPATARKALRASLSAERVPTPDNGIECPRCGWVRRPPPTDPLFPGSVPTPITDEMVERAARALQRRFEESSELGQADPEIRAWDEIDDEARDGYREDARAALDAALNGGER